MLSFSYWYVILGAQLILPVNSHSLYSSSKMHNAAIFYLKSMQLYSYKIGMHIAIVPI